MAFMVSAFFVKMRLERPAGRDKRENKNNFPLILPEQSGGNSKWFPARNYNDQTRYKPCFLDFSSLAA